MGCFDEVKFKCPECGTFLLVQTKAGDCAMEVYTPDSVPLAIAADLHGIIETCPGCKADVSLVNTVRDMVPMIPVIRHND